MNSKLESIIQKFATRRVLVVGDVMLDEYIWGVVSRISPEAPVMVVDAESYSKVPGGAANVVNNLCALGATGVVMGVVGNDDAGQVLGAALQAEGAETTGLVVVDDRPTTRKVRVVAHSQQVVRVDHEKRKPLTEDCIQRLITLLEELIPGADAVILSDYQKGVVAPEIIRNCVRLARLYDKPLAGNLKPVILDSDCQLTVITLNLAEAALAVSSPSLDTDEKLYAAGAQILSKTGAEYVLITRGAHGLSLFPRTNPSEPYYVPPRKVEVFDVAGAGDTVISTLTLALACGASPQEAAVIANCAAAEVVKKVGVSTVSRQEIINAFSLSDATSAEIKTVADSVQA